MAPLVGEVAAVVLLDVQADLKHEEEEVSKVPAVPHLCGTHHVLRALSGKTRARTSTKEIEVEDTSRFPPVHVRAPKRTSWCPHFLFTTYLGVFMVAQVVAGHEAGHWVPVGVREDDHPGGVQRVAARAATS